MTTYSEIFSEAIEQINSAQSLPRRHIKTADLFEILATLPHPSGYGSFQCGSEAYKIIRRASQEAFKNSKQATQIDEDDVFTHVKSLFSKWYLTGSRKICPTSAGKLVAEAIKQASIEIKRRTHIYPVHLGHANGLEEFSIGPVNFAGGRTKKEIIERYIETYKVQEINKVDKLQWYIDDCDKYYSSFGWIAIVDVEPCVHKISWRHGKKQTQDAINCINILLGQHYSCHMIVGGPQFSTDRRSGLSIEESGHIEISSSIDWLGHALGEAWWHTLNEGRGNEIVNLMGIAVREGNRLNKPNNLSTRIFDAASWYGEAVRDGSPLSSIVKYVTALERLFITKKLKGNLKSSFEERAAAFTFSAIGGDIEDIRKHFSRLYTLRSNIVHGKATPHTSKLIADIYELDRYVRIAIQQYIYIAREEGLTKESTISQLEKWLEKIVETSKELASEMS